MKWNWYSPHSSGLHWSGPGETSTVNKTQHPVVKRKREDRTGKGYTADFS